MVASGPIGMGHLIALDCSCQATKGVGRTYVMNLGCTVDWHLVPDACRAVPCIGIGRTTRSTNRNCLRELRLLPGVKRQDLCADPCSDGGDVTCKANRSRRCGCVVRIFHAAFAPSFSPYKLTYPCRFVWYFYIVCVTFRRC